MDNRIITISRQFGSGGRLVGRQLAEGLNLPYYDKNILDDIAVENGYSKEKIEEDEKRALNSFFYSMTNAFGTAGIGPENLSINERFFMAQFDYITKIGQEGKGGVIVGRCADYVLRDEPGVMNVFLYADKEVRLERAVTDYEVPRDQVEKLMRTVDKARANYYRYHTGQRWGDPEHYHMAINTGYLNVDKIVELIKAYMDLRDRNK